MSQPMPPRAASQTAPARGAFAVIPSSTPLAHVTRALYIGSGGTVAVEMETGDLVSFHNVPNGSVLPIHAARVLPATNASDIVALI